MCKTDLAVRKYTSSRNPLELLSEEKSEALFAAVLVHDDLYPRATLPEHIHLNYSQKQLSECYLTCLTVWQQGVDRKVLRRVIRKYYHQQTLNPDDQLSFKHMRAKFKHLRFAYASFTKRHEYPRLFHWTIAVLGYLQDASKNGQRKMVDTSVTLMRFLLSKRAYAIVIRQLEHFEPTSPQEFRQHVCDEIKSIRLNLAQEKITGNVFHDMRKVISQLVALYDNLKVLFPSTYHNRISQYLSTTNGLMGRFHDELIVKKFNKTQDYYRDKFSIPDDIRKRLVSFTDKFNPPICQY